MAKFTTRIELYGDAPIEVYTKLHEAMLAANFIRKISIDGKVWYHLPSAEYSFDSTTDTPTTIKNLAVTIVTPLWTKFGVLVTKTTEARAIHGLKPIIP